MKFRFHDLLALVSTIGVFVLVGLGVVDWPAGVAFLGGLAIRQPTPMWAHKKNE